jgi:hypothetical protein
MKTGIKIEDCICGNKNVHTPECKRYRRKKYVHQYVTTNRKEQRLDRKKKHLCASCGHKVKPKVIYPYRCEGCQDRIRKYDLQRKEKLQESNEDR